MLLSEKLPKRQRETAANKTIIWATILIVIFTFTGLQILNFFGISISSFQIAGGLILFLLGGKIILGLRFGVQKKQAELYEFTVVPMAMPLIVGPGTITTLIILVSAYGYSTILLSAALNLIILWFVFRYAHLLYKIIGHQGSEVASRLMGIILTAMAIEIIKNGLILSF